MLIFVFLEAVLLYIVGVYGEGPNILQKVQNAWMLVSGTSVAVIVGLLYLMGKDRMRLVDIPLPQLFGNADKEK